MARVGYLTIPPTQEELYWGTLQPGDRFTLPRIVRKSAFFSRKKIAGLTKKSYLPAVSAVWGLFSDQKKADWKTVDPHPHKHGWRTFVADKCKRIKFGIPGNATPDQYHQDMVGAIVIESPASEVKIAQYHPAQYYVWQKVAGTKSQYNPVSVTEALALPLEITLNYQSNLISAGGGAFAKFYATVRHFYQGQNLDTDLAINIPIDLDLADSFDFYNNGQLQGQGGWAGDTDFVVNADYRYGDSGKGIRGNADAFGPKTIVHTTGSKAKGKLSFKCQPKATNERFGLYLTSPGGIAGFFIFLENGTVVYFDGVDFQIIKSSYNADQWYKCQIEWDADRGANGEIRYKIDAEEWTAWDVGAIAFNTIEGMVMWMSSPNSVGWFDDFRDEWKTDNNTLISVLGEVSSYNLYIHLYNVRGTLLFDNPKAEHSAQNWVRDPYCKDISKTFTRAFYQVPKHWATITLPVGTAYSSRYPD